MGLGLLWGGLQLKPQWSPDLHKIVHLLVVHKDIFDHLKVVSVENQYLVIAQISSQLFYLVHSYPDKIS
jgi:hypothetical protein